MNFHKIFPFEVYLLVGTLWHLYETSEICEPYQFSAWIDRMVLNEAGKLFSGRVQEQRLMSALDQLLVRFIKEEIHPFFSRAIR